MAELIVEPIQTAELESSGYIGQPEGNIDLTENNVQVNVAPYKYATPKIPIQEDVLAVNPSTQEQTIVPDIGYEGMKSVKVNPANLESKRVTPTTEEQTIVPQSPAIGFSQFTVEPVTSSIDPDIQPENIKQGVDILGVQGTLKPPTLITKQITENGTYAAADDNADGYSEVEVDVDINQKLDAYIQGDLTNIVTNATKIAPSIFRNTRITRVSMLNATEIGRQAFFSCAYLVSVNLSNNLIAIKESAFQSDKNLELSELPDSLGTIESSAFNSCNKIAITKLPKNIKKIFAAAFSNCTSIPYLDVSEVLQIPSLSNSDAFFNTTFPFYFADQTQLNSWASASNWSALASRFQIKPSGV